ncbi:BNR repeat-containing protein [Millionella massiliensis]|uniref:BNR repeat-containing protein n=1 Tax=Millionella massiliensis TaxID=1871023 RepID=UPI0024B6A99C|nr:BNR repeat-containing protein [Millionella massiliensis]
MKPIHIFACAALLFATGCARQPKERTLEIDRVVADFPVDFALVTADPYQYVAYYDSAHVMTVAARRLDEDQWQYQKLPSKVGWDSHNYIAMKVDREGMIHLSGNMHGVPLVYFRTERPHDITTFRPIHRMTGKDETNVTYPRFMDGPDGTLVFHYRGAGPRHANTVYNQYDYATQQWTRLLDTPIMDGEGMCAYFKGPDLGPDDYYHVVWVWRDTPDCSTNHHLSHARSRDLIHWESAGGVPTELPITIADTAFWVDPIPVRGGIINGAADFGFDHENRPMITYYKYDTAGNSQAYVARWENDAWNIVCLSDWDYRWEFQGEGSIGTFPIKLTPAQPQDDGLIRIGYRHAQYGTGYWLLDDASLKIVANEIQSTDSDVQNDLAQENPSELRKYPRRALDSGTSLPEDHTYRLEWETYPANRDRKRDGAPVEPSTLRLIEQSR